MTDFRDDRGGSRFDADLDALAELLDTGALDVDASSGIAPLPADAPVPMSFSQELLWLLDRATPGLTAYNLPIARRLRGPLDVPVLERALSMLVSRHASLRTRLAEVDGEPRQIVDAPASVIVNLVDLRGVPVDEREREAQKVVRERSRTSFDMAREHLFRATLVRIAADDHVLLLESHHIVLDGWSLGILFRELATAYAAGRAGRDVTLPPVAIQYGDYAAWQRAQLTGDRLRDLLSFWRAQLGDATEPLGLPTDHPRSLVPTFSGARETIVLPPDTLARVKSLGRAHDATLYMVLLAAYATVLHRYTGREDVLVGSGSAGRTQAETEGLVGYLNTTLVQHADFAGDPSFGELLARVRAAALGAYDHQEVPLEKLVLELRQGDARLSHAPLFEVVMTMQDTLASSFALDGLGVEPFGADLGATKFDITLLPAERKGGLVLTVQYRSDLFTPETMRRFLGHLQAVLDKGEGNAAVRVSAIPMLSAEECAQLAAWNSTEIDEGPAATLVELFEAQAARVAGRVAVVAPSGAAGSVADTVTLTYRELNARANQLAHHLRSLGTAAGVPVGLLLDRSADAIVGLLGILKAGGAYVPLSIDAPPARLAQQLGDCGAAVVVTSAALGEKLASNVQLVALDRDAPMLGGLSDANPGTVAAPDCLAYVLYTSGSTGVPKGVAVTHANAVHYARAVRHVLGPSAEEPTDGRARQYGLASTLAADLGNTSVFPALLSGATLHVLGKDVTTEPERFAEYMSVHQLDVLKITPNHLRALTAGRTDAGLAEVLPREWVVTGGEALGLAFARTLLGAGRCRVMNHYGPTETTVGVLTYEVTSASLAAAESMGALTVPLGRPLANTHAYVVDAHGQEQPITIAGELWLGGAGVAQGYLKRDELTAERFVTFRDERVYRTGDRVRRLADGTIEFLGRIDHQVKVRGYRVELGEIEQVLRTHPGVADAVVILREDGAGEPRLIAYAVAKQAGYAVSHSDRPTREKLAEWIAAQLPGYMVPAAVILLDAMPLTPNGKLDRAALPVPDGEVVATQGYVAPRTPTETQLAQIWAEVLKREQVGITDNFLTLGGHSLMAIRVLGRISKTFGVRMPLRTLFETLTVEALASAIDAERATGGQSANVIRAVKRDAYRLDKPVPAGGSGDGTGGAG